MIATLKLLSICNCGFPALDESIPLGTEYVLREGSEMEMLFRCGGCHKEMRITWIYVSRNNSGGFLPKLIFFG